MSTEVCKIEKGRDHAKNLHLKVLTMYMGGCYHRDIEIKQYINDISIFIVRFAVRLTIKSQAPKQNFREKF